MAYTAPQIATILLKADKTMYKIGQIAYENMFAEDNEALDYERDVIFIYKKAVEYADDFFVGTEKLDKVVERLATKISAYDYGVLNPIYADAATINTPVLLPGSALNDLTDVTISNLLDNQLLRYNTATGQWINVGPGAAVRNSQAFTATAGQTVFTTSYPFDAGLFDLYVNGVKLNSLSYTTMGEYQITLNDPCIAGDIVDVVIYDSYTGINPSIGSLNDLTDVSIGALTNNQALYYNSATGLWQNGLVFVPYTGATASVDLGEFEIRAGQFTLDTSPTGTATVGTTRWNDSIGSSETTLKGGSVILKNGVDLVARVVNKVTPNTTLTKASYAAVRISGAQGQRLAVAYAQANNDANSADTIGLVTETIATNQEGFIMTMGSLEGINTTGSLQGETWADGDVLYLSPTVPGRITNVKPTGATGHIVVVGYVEYAHANNGKIYVKTMNGWELDELHNVNINTGTLANGDVLKYNATTQLWENGVDTGGITGTGVAGQVPYFTGATSLGGSNNLFWDNTNGRLGIGTNAPNNPITINVNENLGKGVSIVNSSSGNNSRAHIFVQNNIGEASYLSIWGSNTGLSNKTIFGAAKDFLIGTDSNAPSGGTSKFQIFVGGYNAATSPQLSFHATANLSIGSTADNGQRLQVYGDTLLRGSGATSATTALTVQNSSSTNLLTVRNDGALLVGTGVFNGAPLQVIGDITASGGIFSNTFGYNYSLGNTKVFTQLGNTTGILLTIRSTISYTGTGDQTSCLIENSTFAPTSGSGIYNGLLIRPTINQVGANGITRGLYVNPTLTSAADFRAIETTAGNVLIGTNANQAAGVFITNSSTGNNQRAVLRLINNTGEVGELSCWGSGTGLANKTLFTASKDFIIGTDSGIPSGGTSKFQIFVGGYNRATSPQLSFHATANLSIGSTADNGQRLQVYGDTLLRGSGATSATTALTVQNSSSTNILFVRNDGNVGIGTNAPERPLHVVGLAKISTGILSPSLSSEGSVLTIGGSSSRIETTPSAPDGYAWNFLGGTQNRTSGDLGSFRTIHIFAPTSGTSTYNGILLANTINQTGGANGITRGLYINPTLTAAADFRAIEVSAGVTVLAPSVTARASLRIPSGTAPTSPVDGDIWFDGTDIKMRIGGVTKTFTLI